MISNATPIGRASSGQNLNTGGPVPSSFVFGKDANSNQSHYLKKLKEKAQPSTPLGGSY